MTTLPSIVGRYDVTPWDVLLDQVQRAAYRTDWVDRICDTIVGEMNDLQRNMAYDPNSDENRFAEIKYRNLRTELKEWLKESRDERKHLVAVSNDCIKHDIQKYLIMKSEINGRLIAKVLSDAVDGAQLDAEARRRVTRGLRFALENINGDGGSGQARGLDLLPDAFGKLSVQVRELPEQYSERLPE